MHYFFLLFHAFVSENTLLASFELLKFIVGSRAPADGNKTNGNGSFIPESQIMPPLLFFTPQPRCQEFQTASPFLIGLNTLNKLTLGKFE